MSVGTTATLTLSRAPVIRLGRDPFDRLPEFNLIRGERAAQTLIFLATHRSGNRIAVVHEDGFGRSPPSHERPSLLKKSNSSLLEA